LKKIKKTRDDQAVEKSFNTLTLYPETAGGYLLQLVFNSARANATLGEISLALEKVFGR